MSEIRQESQASALNEWVDRLPPSQLHSLEAALVAAQLPGCFKIEATAWKAGLPHVRLSWKGEGRTAALGAGTCHQSMG